MAELSLNINHVGLAVGNLTAAMAWYSETLDFQAYPKTMTIRRDENPENPAFKAFDADMTWVKLGFLTSGNGVGLELFEYEEPYLHSPYWDGSLWTQPDGFIHIAVTAPDPELTHRRIVNAGGRKIGETMVIGSASAIYTSDPWGNIIEIVGCKWEGITPNLFEYD